MVVPTPTATPFTPATSGLSNFEIVVIQRLPCGASPPDPALAAAKTEMSFPAVKLSPSDVSSATRIDLSAEAFSSASAAPRYMSFDRAFFLSGRFHVISITPLATDTFRCSVMTAPLFHAGVGEVVSARGVEHLERVGFDPTELVVVEDPVRPRDLDVGRCRRERISVCLLGIFRSWEGAPFHNLVAWLARPTAVGREGERRLRVICRHP